MSPCYLLPNFTDSEYDQDILKNLDRGTRLLFSQEISQQTFDTVLSMIKRLRSSPTEEKYRRLRIGNKTVRSKLLDPVGALILLRAIGFTEKKQFDGENYLVCEAVPSQALESRWELCELWFTILHTHDSKDLWPVIRIRNPTSGTIVRATFRGDESIASVHYFAQQHFHIHEDFFLFYYGDSCSSAGDSCDEQERFSEHDVSRTIQDQQLSKYTLMIGKSGDHGEQARKAWVERMEHEQLMVSKEKQQKALLLQQQKQQVHEMRIKGREDVLRQFQEDREDQLVRNLGVTLQLKGDTQETSLKDESR